MQHLVLLLLLLIMVITESCALYLLRLRGGIRNIIFASVIFALIVVPILSVCIKYEDMGMTNFIWNILSTIIMFGIGFLFFHETLTNKQKLGIGVSLIGLLILYIPDTTLKL